MNLIAKWLVYVGALNWGLVGVGYFFDANLNLVNLLVGKVTALEPIVYILVGLAAIWSIFGGRK